MGDGCQLKFAMVDLVEAVARCGEDKRVEALCEDLANIAQRSAVPSLLGDLPRARALTCGHARETEQLYRSAVEQHERTRGPGHRARSHQLYGEWLRRGKRTKEARQQLWTAHGLFDAMGADGFAARVAVELSAAGDPLQPRNARPGGGRER
jgi:hypothetical protein